MSIDGATMWVTHCPYCAGDRLLPEHSGLRDRLHVSRAVWSFSRCGDCGSLILSPRPEPDAMAGYYPTAYTITPGRKRAQGALSAFVAHGERLFFGLQDRTQRRRMIGGAKVTGASRPRLLDVGCGDGRRLQQYAALGLDVAGADFRSDSTASLRQAGVDVYECAVERLDETVEPGSFDIVTASYVLEHVNDPRRMLSACRTVLKPGGWLALAVPLAGCLQDEYLGPRWSQVNEVPRHMTIPSPRGLSLVLREAGLDELSMTPDSAIACAAMLTLSYIPESAASIVASDPTPRRVARRALAGAMLVPTTVWSLVENHVLHRPASVIVHARKAGREGSFSR